MSTHALYRWHEGELSPLDDDEAGHYSIEAAESWLVAGGRALALELHRQRFTAAIAESGHGGLDIEEFWRAASSAVPAEGEWFPRVELRATSDGPQLVYRHRPAPVRARTIMLATHLGDDPRTAPTVKGPDLAAMAQLRAHARERGADDAVLLSHEGHVIEGASTALLWWEGPVLFAPAPELPMIDSVTARCVLGVAHALGVEVRSARVRPADLEGREVWAVNALHGIRIVTTWVDGPTLAAEPGRLGLWRDRLDALRTHTEGPA